MNALLGVGVAAATLRESEAALKLAETPEPSTPKLLDTARGNLLDGARHPKLRNIIEAMYRKTARIGSGSTADAIRYELRNGELISKTGHLIKGQEMRTSLLRLIDSGELGEADAQIARGLLADLQGALSGQ